MQKLIEIINKKRKKAIGLMSGTSADGIDAALVEIEGNGEGTSFRLIEFITHPFPADIQERIFRLFAPSVCPVEEICEMNFLIGDAFAEAALNVVSKAGMKPEDVDIIGSHGQTICHLPDRHPRSTLQIGEPSVIADRTGILTVADFRVADVAAGGHGAPLVPYVDFLLLKSEKSRAIQNIGGIGNVTFLPANCSLEGIIGFDTGPGNMVIDELVRILTKGEKNFDRNGEMASRGSIDKQLLQKLLSHPFIHRPPPKTTGREDFGASFARRLIGSGIEDGDLIATVTMFTSESIYLNYMKFIMPEHDISEIIISGGGLYNHALMGFLRERFYPIPVRGIDDFGIRSDAKEAIAFAILANEAIHGNTGNVPNVTGAERYKVLGKIVQAS